MKNIFLLGVFLAASTLLPLPSAADEATPTRLPSYRYECNEAEYSVSLPDAPTVTTIWADDASIPYIDAPPSLGSIGEVATFDETDINTEETFDVKITFLKATPDFLKSLTKEKMQETLENEVKDIRMKGEKAGFSAGTDNVLKWATLSGFWIDKDNKPFHIALHYLTGKKSIMVIRIQYNVGNKKFESYYKNLVDNINYSPT